MTAMFLRRMKVLAFMAAGISLASCVESQDGTGSAMEPIRFEVKGENMLATKAMSERTSVTGFTCLALKPDNSILVDNVATARSGSDEVLSDIYWPASGNCSFFGVLPETAMTGSSGVVTFPVGTSSSKLDGTEDYVFASNRNAPNGQPVTMVFSHILSNMAGLRLTGEKSGTTTTVTSITLSHPRYGTYQCSQAGDSWIRLGENENTFLSVDFRSASHASGPVIEGNETGSSVDDFSLIPGTWTVRFRYSVAAGSLKRDYDKSGRVGFVAGRKCIVSTTLTNDISPLELSVSVLDWEEGNSATAWVEDLRPGRYIAVDLDGGWKDSDKPIVDHPERYYGLYEAVKNHEMERIYRSMKISFRGFDTFRFYVGTPRVQWIYDAILISKPDKDLVSIVNSAQAASAYAHENCYQYVFGSNHSDYQFGLQDTEDLFTEVMFKGLDPLREYTVQVVTGMIDYSSENYGYVYIPKEEYQKPQKVVMPVWMSMPLYLNVNYQNLSSLGTTIYVPSRWDDEDAMLGCYTIDAVRIRGFETFEMYVAAGELSTVNVLEPEDSGEYNGIAHDTYRTGSYRTGTVNVPIEQALAHHYVFSDLDPYKTYIVGAVMSGDTGGCIVIPDDGDIEYKKDWYLYYY